MTRIDRVVCSYVEMSGGSGGGMIQLPHVLRLATGVLSPGPLDTFQMPVDVQHRYGSAGNR